MIDDELDVNFTIKATLEETGLFQVDTLYDTKSALSIFRPASMIWRFRHQNARNEWLSLM